MKDIRTSSFLYALVEDMFDVLMKNTKYMTQDEFLEKYKDLEFEFSGCDMDEQHPYISIKTKDGQTILMTPKIK